MLFQGCKRSDDEFDGEIRNSADFEIYLEQEMAVQNIPAMSVILFDKESILYEKYLGKTNLNDDINLKSDHLFLLASVSKVITATALLQLYEENLFSLTDNINDYLPFSVAVPDYSQPITFNMLLTHTSAITDGSALDDQYYYGEDSPVALDFFMENYLVPNGKFYDAYENFSSFEPGSEYIYSNIGSALLAVLVEEISGLDFNEYCKQNIFNPLEMNNTFWRLGDITQPIVQPYRYRNRRFEEIQHYTFKDYPNGGLRSTSRDLHTFLTAFVNGGVSNNYKLLSVATLNEMLKPQIQKIDNSVGLHMFKLNDEHELWGHDGGEQGVSTIVGFNTTSKKGAIILTNQGDAKLDEILEEGYKLAVKLK